MKLAYNARKCLQEDSYPRMRSRGKKTGSHGQTDVYLMANQLALRLSYIYFTIKSPGHQGTRKHCLVQYLFNQIKIQEQRKTSYTVSNNVGALVVFINLQCFKVSANSLCKCKGPTIFTFKYNCHIVKKKI